MFRLRNRGVRRQAGFTMVEILISVVLLSLLSLITVTGMIFHARMAQSNLTKQRMAESARRFVETAQIAVLDATIVRVEDGPSGENTVLTIGRPDPANPGAVVFKQYAYIDGDNNPATIRDNRIVERDVNTPMATTGKVVVDFCSPVTGSHVFSEHPDAHYALYQINLRVGDRTHPASNADDGITGKGYQSFLINAHLARG